MTTSDLRSRRRRCLPLVAWLALLGLAAYLGLLNTISLATLQHHQASLQAWVHTAPLMARAGFALAYVTVVALSVPGAFAMTMLAGFLFGWVEGLVLVVVSATVGATVVFAVVRTSVGAWLSKAARGWAKVFVEGFRADGASYLLSLRLLPLMPFWVVNLLAGTMGVPMGLYVWTTAVGIVPGATLYVYLGQGLSDELVRGDLTVNAFKQPAVLWPMVGLGLLPLLPLVHRLWKGRRNLRAFRQESMHVE